MQLREIIKVSNLTKDYGNNKGIFDVSFSINEGEVVGFLGPNGAGKTTTIRHLLGLIQKYHGSAFIKEYNCFTEQVLVQKYIGYLPGEIKFIEDFDGDSFIRFMAKMKDIKDLSYAYELVKYFELDISKKINKMSKGMKQKLGLIVAFMNKPEILILDEPSSGLDPLMQHKLVDLIIQHKQMKATIFLSSHMFDEVEKTCDRIIMIKEGRIVADSSIKDIKAKMQDIYMIRFSTEEMASRFVNNTGGSIINKATVEYRLSESLNKLIKQLVEFDILEITKKKQTLEELFMQYYGDVYD